MKVPICIQPPLLCAGHELFVPLHWWLANYISYSLCHRSVHLWIYIPCVCVCVCASYLGADVFVFQMISFLHSDEYRYTYCSSLQNNSNSKFWMVCTLSCMLMYLRYSCIHFGKSIVTAIITVTCLRICTQVSICRHSSNSNFKCQLHVQVLYCSSTNPVL